MPPPRVPSAPSAPKPAATARTCPGCGAGNVATILYGMPGVEVADDVDAGRVKLGGCVIGPDMPTHHCNVCGIDFAVSRRKKGTR